MRCLRPCLSVCVFFALCALAPGQQPRQAIVLFKDGFRVRGQVLEKKELIIDSATGKSFSVPDANGFLYVDDYVRRIHFSPAQVQDPKEIKPGDIPDQMFVKRYDWYRRRDMILPGWEFDKVTPWNDKWQRTILVRTQHGNGRLNITQRIMLLTPTQVQAMTVGYNWDLAYLTHEFTPEQVHELLWDYYKTQKDVKEPDRYLNVARFMQQAGWLEQAEKELLEVQKKDIGEKKAIDTQLQQVREERATTFVEDTENRAKIGQHGEVQERLKTYDSEKYAENTPAKLQLVMQDLKTKYEASATQLAEAQALLKDLPERTTGNRAFWTSTAGVILGELNYDTLPRLETFLSFAQQHVRDLKDKGKPAQTTEEVLALAVTGWLQGSQAAEPDVKSAQRLFGARKMILDYLRNESAFLRQQSVADFQKDKESELPADVLVRLVRLLPPVQPYEKLGTAPIKLQVELPETPQTTYHVQLPPDYNHQRPHPVLMLLQGGREGADTLMSRWSEHAARHGFILVAPEWSDALRPAYHYTAREHAVVLDTLRDLRRRFQIDSDRVFLFGWETGADMAFDVGLSHPDQFAGVLPMNGSVRSFPLRYANNAQYLPFYIIEGDRNGGNPKATRTLFKEWIRGHYPSIYVEYKGRASEWYGAELPIMMDWMSRKKRAHPTRDLGRVGEEFRTSRDCDNRFYWLSTDSIHPRHINDHDNWVHHTLPATLQASYSVGNELDKNGARVWNQYSIHTKGINQLTLWIEAGLYDFSKPLVIRVNNGATGSRPVTPSLATMLEQLYSSGDRQRLILAKVDMKL